MSTTIERLMPKPPDWHLEWDAIDAAFPWIRKLCGSGQDPVHHAEGDVWTHVAMVAHELTVAADWRACSMEERLVVFAAALLHDVCKPETRREMDGRVTNPRHSRMGANEAAPDSVAHGHAHPSPGAGLYAHRGAPGPVLAAEARQLGNPAHPDRDKPVTSSLVVASQARIQSGPATQWSFLGDGWGRE